MLMLASLWLLLSGTCVPPWRVLAWSMDVVWEKAGSGQAPLLQSLTEAGQDSGVLVEFVGAGVSWMGSILFFISCPNTTGSPACPDITLGLQGGVQARGAGTKSPVSSPISSGWKLQTQLGKKRPESCGVLGIRTTVSLSQAPSYPGNRD